jgi:hypothetical protein
MAMCLKSSPLPQAINNNIASLSSSKTGQIVSCISGFLPIVDIDALVGRPKSTGKNNAFL